MNTAGTLVAPKRHKNRMMQVTGIEREGFGEFEKDETLYLSRAARMS
jgi:hypothetical protein